MIRLLACLTLAASMTAADIPRTADGRPDLSGTYDAATLTPLQRPAKYGDRLELTDAEAEAIARQEAETMAKQNEASDPNREAPPEGGDGSPGAAGNVGGYNSFWIDRGTGAFQDQRQMAHVDHHRPAQRPPAAEDA